MIILNLRTKDMVHDRGSQRVGNHSYVIFYAQLPAFLWAQGCVSDNWKFRKLFGLEKSAKNVSRKCSIESGKYTGLSKTEHLVENWSLHHCAFHKHANSKVLKPPSQLRFSLLSIIITITSNEPWNTEIGFFTLCFCFPTKMLHLNAPLFPLKCSVSPKKSLKCSDIAHYTNGFLN